MLIDSPTITGSLQISGNNIDLPSGGDSQRPSSPVTGSLRYNTDSGSLEIYDGIGTNGWAAIGSSSASVGPALVELEYLVIAGGGGGGSYGGGGAGGYLSSSLSSMESGSSITVTVGGGGAGSGNSYTTEGTSGVDSSIASAGGTSFTTVTSTGGGGGGDNLDGADDGGSGGGGSDGPTDNTGGSGTVGQGNDGGDGTYSDPNYMGGGGGGAGTAGADATTSAAGDGGDGLASKITGTSTTRAGGGGGVRYNTSGTWGDGGTGGGGDGGTWNATTTAMSSNTAGTENSGGGGGAGKAGGKGVVIFAYDSGSIGGVGGDVVGDAGNGRKYHQFNSSGTFILTGNYAGESVNNPAGSPAALRSAGITTDGTYWINAPNEGQTGGAIEAEVKFNMVDSKDWVRLFTNTNGGSATTNYIDLSIPFKGLCIEDPSGDLFYSYFSSFTAFNTRNSTDTTTGGNRSGYKVFFGYAGGMGFYNSAVLGTCNWSNNSGGEGAGYNGTCGAWPNTLVMGHSGSPFISEENGTWNFWFWMDNAT